MSIKIKKNVALTVAGAGALIIFVFLLFSFIKPSSSKKMTIDYINSSKYAIKNCRREAGYAQNLTGTYDNVVYNMHFPIFGQRQWTNTVFKDISDKIYNYKKELLSDSLVDDKFELFSNYQTFRSDENEENVSIQMQFYEKNLTKKSENEIIKTFVFSGNELIDEKRFFKRSCCNKVVDEIRAAFVAKFPKFQNANLDDVLPYSLKTLHNFVVSNDSIIFFYDRGSVLKKGGIVSIEVDKSKLSEFINKNGNRLGMSYDSKNHKPMVALTFDDGPDGKQTEELLEVLKANGARATFFVVGKQVEKHPELLKKMVDYDCEIGNHTYSHANLNSLSEKALNKEIETTNKLIEQATDGYRASLMRPPFNNCNNKVKDMLKQPIIQWSIDTLDWKHKNVSKTIEIVLDRVSDGSIVLMHDIHKSSVEAAKILIPKLIESGYDLVTVSEMAQIKGEQLNPHNKYSRIRNE